MKTIITYVCEICNSSYSTVEFAQACEQSTPPPKFYEIGQEIKLKNRSAGYTLAIIKALHLVQSYFAHSQNYFTQSDVTKKELSNIHRHEWQLELDREVYLDYCWERSTNLIPSYYILKGDHPQAKIRDDNNCY